MFLFVFNYATLAVVLWGSLIFRFSCYCFIANLHSDGVVRPAPKYTQLACRVVIILAFKPLGTISCSVRFSIAVEFVINQPKLIDSYTIKQRCFNNKVAFAYLL